MWRFLRNRRLILRLHTIFRALIYWAHRAVILAIAWFSSISMQTLTTCDDFCEEIPTKISRRRNPRSVTDSFGGLGPEVYLLSYIGNFVHPMIPSPERVCLGSDVNVVYAPVDRLMTCRVCVYCVQLLLFCSALNLQCCCRKKIQYIVM